ncbi:hypothetical protein CIB93_02640 [Streptomyces sp. WZ.A104]|uniref:hypothetical protein n=1 Tax=Streptomyces sp. WZ.A104 TaxID=2023771 RepID=UPI000BBC076C|nr:hypothetical protein [Streptomyces sp. WZ.A104]PCG87610.1 hypothetical protein CIB93_02640 [Streptomyces sp. WZ.A104]
MTTKPEHEKTNEEFISPRRSEQSGPVAYTRYRCTWTRARDEVIGQLWLGLATFTGSIIALIVAANSEPGPDNETATALVWAWALGIAAVISFVLTLWRWPVEYRAHPPAPGDQTP